MFYFKGIEINVSYKELTEKLRENLGNPSDWRPNLGFPVINYFFKSRIGETIELRYPFMVPRVNSNAN